jgi:hypothetical protein
MRNFILKLYYKLMMTTGLYGLWSMIYRFVWESKYKNLELPAVSSLQELANILKGMVWRADGVREFGDAMSSAEATWGRYRDNKPAGDCDDFAAFITHTILNSQKQYDAFRELTDLKIMNVCWRSGKVLGGHNFAIFKDGERIGVMDYDMPDWFDTLEQVRDFIVKKYSGGNLYVGWATMDPVMLKPIEWEK